MKRGSEKPKIDEILEADQDAKQTRRVERKQQLRLPNLPALEWMSPNWKSFTPSRIRFRPRWLRSQLAWFEDYWKWKSLPVLAENFMSYSKRARGKLLALDDPMLISLLEDEVDEEIILDVLSAGSIQNASVEKLAGSNRNQFIRPGNSRPRRQTKRVR